MTAKLGLIVNPFAGLGGRVGLKGSDGKETIRRAIALGARPEAPGRAVEALRALGDLASGVDLVTYPYEMGEEEARQAGFSPTVLGSIARGETTPEDTERAARDLREAQVDLLLFVGGDGTARNVCSAIGRELPALGVPAGVKIHSAVYATTPRSAGELARLVLEGRVGRYQDAEVMDIDEDAFRQGRVSARLYGYLKVPADQAHVQNMKSGRAQGDEAALAAIAEHVIEDMEGQMERLYILGPGTTTKAIKDRLGIAGTLLGVDLVQGKRLVGADVGERDILARTQGVPATVVVTIIGGQGYIFGRGNQQLSPGVLAQVGIGNVLVVATRQKVIDLRGAPLLVDTGDPATDQSLRGYRRIVTGYHDTLVYRVDG